ncbi:PcfJ domain-containing protein [Endozoicomonas sp. ALE010]|uniref:PcfJ domain-containing protein n=1 Tax=Endozoicomonas sp. ALE010 TaxID=3403081 RepID=UPI003BB761C2
MQNTALSLPEEKEFTWCDSHHSLTIDCLPYLNYPCKIVVGGWQKKLDWVSIIDHEVEQPEFHSSIAFDLSSMAHCEDIQYWLNTIPEEVQRNIDFFGAHKFFVLKLVAQWQEARDLFFSNPVLLWYWVDFCINHKLDESTARKMLAMKQHQILAAMGMSNSKSLNRLVKKIQIESIQRYFASKLLSIITTPAYLVKLRHLPVIRQEHIDVMIAMPELIHSRLLELLASMGCRWARARLINIIQDCLRMDLALNRELANCNSEAELNRIHDREMARRNRHGIDQRFILLDEQDNPLPFPLPPHPGTEWIKPILTFEALREEGIKMKHCVGSYVRNVQAGTHYIYHMEAPECLTISITMNNGRPLRIEQVAGPCNKTASNEARGAVIPDES